VITSFACTAPFIAGILASGTEAESILEVLVSMCFFGLAMALPFMGLALFPSAIGSLPKSGEWLHTLKVLFGFVVLAAALLFISKVDKSLGWKSLPRELYLYIVAGIAFTAALYLFGLIRLEGESGQIGPSRMFLGMLTLIFTLYCVYGAQGNPLGMILESLTPDYSALRAEGSGAPEGAVPSRAIVEDDFQGGLEKARAEGKLAFINWTGVNCTNCKAMEKSVFTRPEIRRELEKFVELRLHIDRDDPASRDLNAIKEKRLNDISMPIYEIVDPRDNATLDVFRGADTAGARFKDFLSRNAR
jgi:thiol:disulfide interchange protein DsbD